MKRKITFLSIGLLIGLFISIVQTSHWNNETEHIKFAQDFVAEPGIVPQPTIEKSEIDICTYSFVDSVVSEEAVQEYPKYNIPLSDELQKHIYDLCIQQEISHELVLAVIMTESTFDVNKVGDGGDSFGLMQVQPRWWQYMADEHGVSIKEPYGNVEVGIHILKKCFNDNSGNVEKALKQYNSGNPNHSKNDYVNSVFQNMEEVKKLRETT